MKLHIHLIEGCVWIMAPIYVLCLIDLILFLYALFIRFLVKNSGNKLKIINRLAMLGVACGNLASLIGLIGATLGLVQAVDCLSEISEPMPLKILACGFKLTMIPLFYGMGLFLFSVIIWAVLKRTLHPLEKGGCKVKWKSVKIYINPHKNT